MFSSPSTGFELTLLIHCSTNRLALCSIPYCQSITFAKIKYSFNSWNVTLSLKENLGIYVWDIFLFCVSFCCCCVYWSIHNKTHVLCLSTTPVVSEMIKMWCVNGNHVDGQTTDDGRKAIVVANSALFVRWHSKNVIINDIFLECYILFDMTIIWNLTGISICNYISKYVVSN